MPMDISVEDLDRIDGMVATRRKVKRGASLFHNGEAFTSLYAIRTGFFKTCTSTDDGRDQVTGFQMAGEILGLDGIVNDHHTCDAVALEDAEVCVMPFDRIEELSRAGVYTVAFFVFWAVVALSSAMTALLSTSAPTGHDAVPD